MRENASQARYEKLYEKIFLIEARADLADIQNRTIDAHVLYREAGRLREVAESFRPKGINND